MKNSLSDHTDNAKSSYIYCRTNTIRQCFRFFVAISTGILIFVHANAFPQTNGQLSVSQETASAYGLPSGTQTTSGMSLPPVRDPDPTLGVRIAESIPFSVGNSLPSDQGQIGRAYDITSYTNRPTQSQSPQNTITNWVLRRTGNETWHGEPFGFMTATREQLVVYHTPDMQNYIADTVDRFVSSKNAQKSYSLRIVSLAGPDWRNKNYTYLVPIRIDTPGVQGWLVSKSHIGLLLDSISKRNDVREHVSSHSTLLNAQTTVVPYHVTRNYVRDVQARPSAPGGYITDPTSLTEGFQFEITPLLSLDGKTIEARVKCDMVQVDKMHPLTISTASSASPSARVTVEVPQVANFSVDELISWPGDYVLLLDLGIVPLLIPQAQETQQNKGLFDQIIGPLAAGAPRKRSNVLMFIALQSETGVSNVTTYPAQRPDGATQNNTQGNSQANAQGDFEISFEPANSQPSSPQPSTPSSAATFDPAQIPPANPIISPDQSGQPLYQPDAQ